MHLGAFRVPRDAPDEVPEVPDPAAAAADDDVATGEVAAAAMVAAADVAMVADRPATGGDCCRRQERHCSVQPLGAIDWVACRPAVEVPCC